MNPTSTLQLPKSIPLSSSKKVCITTLEFPPDIGGVGESAYRIAQMLKQLGYEVHVAVFRAVFREERKLAEAGSYRRSQCLSTELDGVKVHRLKAAVRTVNATTQDYLCEIYSLLKLLHQQHQFDLFHAFFINETGFLTTLLAKENGIPVINSIRGNDLHKHIFAPKQHSQICWTLENSDWVTFVSRYLMGRAKVLVPSIDNHASAFWNSIVPIDFDSLPKPALAHKLQGTVIGMVGRFRDKKGLEYVLDACAELKTQYEITLLLVGDFVDKERDYWQQEVANSGLEANLVITGILDRSQAIAYLPYIDIFAIPSLHDGCPNALLEAMLAGRAVVGTDIDAIGEIIDHEVDGLLVDPCNSQQLTKAIATLIANPDLRQKLAQSAQIKAQQQLSPAVEQQNWRQVYQQVLSVSSNGRSL